MEKNEEQWQRLIKVSLKENSPVWNFKRFLCKLISTLILSRGNKILVFM